MLQHIEVQLGVFILGCVLLNAFRRIGQHLVQLGLLRQALLFSGFVLLPLKLFALKPLALSLDNSLVLR